MPSFLNSQIPPPKNWQDFEDLCADLWCEIWDDPNAQKNGRSGQNQKGVDIYGQKNGKYCAVQCKGKDGRYGAKLTKKELLSEVKKAKGFEPKLSSFVIATSAPSDEKIQEEARKLTVQNKMSGFFSVHVFSWDEIHSRLAKSTHNLVLKDHYPEYYKEDKPNNSQKVQVTRLPYTNNRLFGRTFELDLLDNEWADNKTNIFCLKALGGAGKTALVKKWLELLAAKNFKDANAVYAWSFYSQGSTENTQVSADEFFDEALKWFGYEGEPIASAYSKGLKLAELINNQKTLLILDGLEPLQYPVGTMRGLLKDRGLEALLKQLAIKNEGLCIVSSRQNIEEIAENQHVYSYDLDHLKNEDSVALLRNIGVSGKQQDLELATKEVAHHALSLNLLGQFIKTVFEGDIRQRDKIPHLSSERREGKHAEKILAAYKTHLKGTAQLSVLYLLGLFDRPVSQVTLQHLRDKKIVNLTDRLNDDVDWQYALDDLKKQQLLSISDVDDSEYIDTHPLIREYFSRKLKKELPTVWQDSHRLLYHYYNYELLPRIELPKNLNEMSPLFLAVAHGCLGGLHKDALDQVLAPRIHREEVNFLGNVLCAHGANLASLSNFFERCWDKPVTTLKEEDRAVLMGWAAFSLRALGRLREAVKPWQKTVAMRRKENNPIGVAINSSNLSELWLFIGNIDNAIKQAKISISAIPDNKLRFKLFFNTTLAEALHKAGHLEDSYKHFILAEQLLDQSEPDTPALYSTGGARACDFLLTIGDWNKAERTAYFGIDYSSRREDSYIVDIAWFECFIGRAKLQKIITVGKRIGDDEIEDLIKENPLLFPSENTVFNVLLNSSNKNEHLLIKNLEQSKHWLDKAIDSFHHAAQEQHTPQGFLARSKLCRWSISFGVQHDSARDGRASNKDQALEDLREVYDISLRCDMSLYLTDYHLECARLAMVVKEDIFDLSVNEHIEKASKLIKATGYKLRSPEVNYLFKQLKKI